MRHLAWTTDDRFCDALRTAQGELIEHEPGMAGPLAHSRFPPADPRLRQLALTGGSETVTWAYRTLTDLPVTPEPERADAQVRWWLDALGRGVVADYEGDVIVHISPRGRET